MKTSDLIHRLQEADPSGEMEVTVGKTDIYFLQVLPGYYDGCYQVLRRDPKNEGKCYNIVGAEIRSNGQHVCIETHSVRDMLWESPEMPVTFGGEYAERHYAGRVEEWREEMREIDKAVSAKLKKN